MPKISALPAMTTADGADPAPIVDDSVGSTKKITLTKMKEWLQSVSAWVTASMVAGIDKSILTTDSNPYKFSVYRNAAWTATSGTVPFDAELFDTNNNFSTSTYQYTAPVNGFYQTDFCVSTDQSNGTGYFARILKNGTTLVAQGNSTISLVNSAFPISSTGSKLIQLTAGDYIELQWTGGTDAGHTAQDRTYWTGYLHSRT